MQGRRISIRFCTGRENTAHSIEFMPLLQNRPWIAIREIKMRLPWNSMRFHGKI
jgi:hypothetical protein